MIIKISDIHSTDFVFTDVVAYQLKPEYEDFYDFEAMGRNKHLIFYQYRNSRCYYRGNTHLYTLNSGDIVFIPHGVKYRTFSVSQENLGFGIGISFNLVTPGGEPIFFDEDIKILTNDADRFYYKYFEKVLYSVINPSRNTLALKSTLYFIAENVFPKEKSAYNEETGFSGIKEAINIIEKHPEKNISTKELAEICFMSEASFLRKFKAYSGGVPPIKYRNNIRLMLAEELSSSILTTAEIAEKLGFYDSAHLCKAYKEMNGTTLKKGM